MNLEEVINTLPQITCFLLEYDAHNMTFAKKVNTQLQSHRALSILMAVGPIKSKKKSIDDNVILLSGESAEKFCSNTKTRFEIIFVHDAIDVATVTPVLTNFGKVYLIGGKDQLTELPVAKLV